MGERKRERVSIYMYEGRRKKEREKESMCEKEREYKRKREISKKRRETKRENRRFLSSGNKLYASRKTHVKMTQVRKKHRVHFNFSAITVVAAATAAAPSKKKIPLFPSLSHAHIYS